MMDIAESETEPLLGLAILRGYRLQVDNVEGGIVKIESHNPKYLRGFDL